MSGKFIISPKGFDMRIGGKKYNDYIKEGFSYNNGQWFKDGQQYIHEVVNPVTGNLIAVGGNEFNELLKKNYIYVKTKNILKKGVKVPGENRVVHLDSPEFKKLTNSSYAYNEKKNTLIKYNKKPKDGYVFDPETGKRIAIGCERYEILRSKGYVVNPSTLIMKMRHIPNQWVVNPETSRLIKINGDKFIYLIRSGYKYIPFTNSLEKDDYLQINDCKDLGHFQRILSKTMITIPVNNAYDFFEYSSMVKPKVIETYRRLFNKRGPIKVGLIVTIRYEMEKKQQQVTEYIWSSSIDRAPVIVEFGDIPNVVNNLFQQIGASVESYQMRDTGWVLDNFGATDVCTYSYDPLSGGSYIPTPKFISAKKAVINVKNQDEKCIIWSILACLYPSNKDANRTSKYQKHINQIINDGISFPIKIEHIPKL